MRSRYILLLFPLLFAFKTVHSDTPDANSYFSVGKFRTCVSTRDCRPTMDCARALRIDTRNCRRKIFAGIKINDPSCEAAKAAQNAAYQIEKSRCEAQKSAQKLDCERLKSQELMPCRQKRGAEIEDSLELQDKLEALYEEGKSAADRALPPNVVFTLSGKVPDLVLWAYRVNHSMIHTHPVDEGLSPGESPETIKNISFPRKPINTAIINSRLIRSLLFSSLYDEIGIDGVSQIWLFEKEKLDKYLLEKAESICSEIQCR